MKKEKSRHILGLSGGKDSTALAIHIKNTRPEIFEKLELYFTDTGTELEETYTYLNKIEEYLGKPIFRIKATTDEKGFMAASENDDLIPFDEFLVKWNGYLPSPIEYIEKNSIDIIKRYVKKQYKKVPDSYKKGFVLTLDEMLDLIDKGKIKEFVDTWDLKRLHDIDGENKEGCTVCAI